MEIIKPGILPRIQTLQGTCDNCKAEITFTSTEATRHANPRTGGYFYLVTCPTVGCFHNINITACE